MIDTTETAQEFIARKTLEFQHEGRVIKSSDELPVEAITFLPDMFSGGRKVFLLERARAEQGPVYRVSYYMMDENDEWTWRRGCPMFNRTEHDRLYAQAILDGTYI